ncbi:MAG: hypothetical protein VSS75_020945, partial [Candidatus Parabeggiatoa sp.]|nr:hypothetical protein [Candidatus Parabeggiatoa sp.]
KIPKTTTLLYAYKYYVTNCLLTQSRRAAENERRLIKGVGILIFWSYLTTYPFSSRRDASRLCL